MEHICNREDMVLINQEGNLMTYQCTKCGKIVHELGSIAVPFAKLEMCRVYVKWHHTGSLSKQICGLKSLIPSITMSNQDLLNMARTDECLEIGEMSISEGKALQSKAKHYNLDLIVRSNI
ncbi:hypothetical protein [Intestinimonas butyriciproducens]|uniref:hypothetical protein n=1 Tax=Intestinimonas butyriciproducens TaxID=1297617 RepID=UPI001957A15E|nr:hypothetical protein [Intestinimonas butyriciproducens]MBM6977594.1 hypothetical protein [Intestinimonas butyriciproducens]